MSKDKKNIPTHDPQTGELNPYYEALTGKKNPWAPIIRADWRESYDKWEPSWTKSLADQIENLPLFSDGIRFTGENSTYYQGITVIPHSMLPYDETVAACSLETREEVRVLTGREMNVIHDKKNNRFYVSQEIYDKVKKEIKEKEL